VEYGTIPPCRVKSHVQTILLTLLGVWCSATKLKEVAETLKDDLCVVMRVYFEKPRTTVGWKGLINDPFLDESFQINKGLRIARGLLCQLVLSLLFLLYFFFIRAINKKKFKSFFSLST
jgi:phospho-2-dehydro-3-deoxyheptonate aldolase